MPWWRIDLNPFDDKGGPLEINLSKDPVDLLDIDLIGAVEGAVGEIDLLSDESLHTIAMVAATVVTGGTAAAAWAIPATNAAVTFAQTGDVETALKAGATSFVTGAISGATGNLAENLVGSAVETVVGTTVSEAGQAAITSALASGVEGVATELITTGDTSLDTFLTAAVTSAASTALEGVKVDLLKDVDTSNIDNVITVVKEAVEAVETVTGEVDLAKAYTAVEEQLIAVHGYVDNGDGTLTDPYGGLYDGDQGGVIKETQRPGYVAPIETAVTTAITAAENATGTVYDTLTDGAKDIITAAITATDTIITTVENITNSDLSALSTAATNVIIDATAASVTQLVTTGEVTSAALTDAIIEAAASTSVVTSALNATKTGNDTLDTITAKAIVASVKTAVAGGDVAAAITAVVDTSAANVLAAAIDETVVGDVINNSVDAFTNNDEKVKAAATTVNAAADVYEGLKADYDGTASKLTSLDAERRELFTAAENAANEYLTFRDGPSKAIALALKADFDKFNATFDTKFNNLSATLTKQGNAAQAELTTYNTAVTAYDTSVGTLATSKTRLTDDLKPIKDGVTKLTALSINPNINEDVLKKVTGLDDTIAAYEEFLKASTATGTLIIQDSVNVFTDITSGMSSGTSSGTLDVEIAPITPMNVAKTVQTLGDPTEVGTAPTVDTDKDTIKLGDNMTPAQFEILGFEESLKSSVVGKPLNKFDLLKLEKLGENVSQNSLAFIKSQTAQGDDVLDLGTIDVDGSGVGGANTQMEAFYAVQDHDGTLNSQQISGLGKLIVPYRIDDNGDTVMSEELTDAELTSLLPNFKEIEAELGVLFSWDDLYTVVAKIFDAASETGKELGNLTLQQKFAQILSTKKGQEDFEDLLKSGAVGIINAGGTMLAGLDQALIQASDAFTSNLTTTTSANPAYDEKTKEFLSGYGGTGAALAETDKTVVDSARTTRMKNHDVDVADGGTLTTAGNYIKNLATGFEEWAFSEEQIKEMQAAGITGDTLSQIQVTGGVKETLQQIANETGEEITELGLAKLFAKNPVLLAIVGGLSAAEAIDGGAQQARAIVEGLAKSGELENSDLYQEALEYYNDQDPNSAVEKAKSFVGSEIMYNSIAAIGGVGFTDALTRGFVGQVVGEGVQEGVEGYAILKAAKEILGLDINTTKDLAANVLTGMVIGGGTSATMNAGTAATDIANSVFRDVTNSIAPETYGGYEYDPQSVYDLSGEQGGGYEGIYGGPKSLLSNLNKALDVTTTTPAQPATPTYDAKAGSELLMTLDNFGADVSSVTALNNTLANLGIVDNNLVLGLNETANDRKALAGFVDKATVKKKLTLLAPANFEINDAVIDALYTQANTSAEEVNINTLTPTFINNFIANKQAEAEEKLNQVALDQAAADKAIQDAKDAETLKQAKLAEKKAADDIITAQAELDAANLLAAETLEKENNTLSEYGFTRDQFNNSGFATVADFTVEQDRLAEVERVAEAERVAAAETLAAETLAAETLAAETLAAETLAAETLAAETLAAETLAAETLAAETLAKENNTLSEYGFTRDQFNNSGFDTVVDFTAEQDRLAAAELAAQDALDQAVLDQAAADQAILDAKTQAAADQAAIDKLLADQAILDAQLAADKLAADTSSTTPGATGSTTPGDSGSAGSHTHTIQAPQYIDVIILPTRK